MTAPPDRGINVSVRGTVRVRFSRCLKRGESLLRIRDRSCSGPGKPPKSSSVVGGGATTDDRNDRRLAARLSVSMPVLSAIRSEGNVGAWEPIGSIRCGAMSNLLTISGRITGLASRGKLVPFTEGLRDLGHSRDLPSVRSKPSA